MAKKSSVAYVCNACGTEHSTYSGKCFTCGEWNSLEERILQPSVVGGSGKSRGNKLSTKTIKNAISKDHQRLSTHTEEVDMVLGGGFVPGSVNLLAGQPGIGKSTLLLQLAQSLSKNHKVLYVSGEESDHQIGMRAARLGVNSSTLQLATSNVTDDIARTINDEKYDVAIVDSIQTIACQDIASAAGNVSQITNSTAMLTQAAKSSDTALILVGHVTKEGNIAGPKVLEHIVDVVLQLEGDRRGGFKVLRAVKNRFGSTNETGIFEMQGDGLQPVANPSEALLAERKVSDGSIVLATMEGTRPLLVEVQALVNRTNYGYPKRAASGIDLNRMNLLIAMLEKRTKLNLADQDIYLNIVGGIKLNEPASDLAMVMAIASASKGMQLSQNVVVFGELGLSGELRHVPFIEKRVAEAKKLGFDGAVGPKTSATIKDYQGMTDVRSVLNALLTK